MLTGARSGRAASSLTPAPRRGHRARGPTRRWRPVTAGGRPAGPLRPDSTRPPGRHCMPIDVRSLSPADALDLAILMEEEARDRYEWFAKLVGGRYAGDAADMFRMMAGYETKHGLELSERRQQLFPTAPRRITADMIDDVEAPDRGTPRVFMSARDAMEVALSSEEKAYEFFQSAL